MLWSPHGQSGVLANKKNSQDGWGWEIVLVEYGLCPVTKIIGERAVEIRQMQKVKIKL
jgi:hypothetical protein